IKRNLKKKSTGIGQDSGYIIIDGKKMEGTAVELKQQIITLLNYPAELLTKSKSLIYKYTVYIPQEEMKYILAENKDIRLDTLRKVFGIDKYKKVKENSKFLLSAIKEKRKETAGMIFDLEQRKEELNQTEKLMTDQNIKITELQPTIQLLTQDIEKKKQEIEQTENQIKELNEMKQQLQGKTAEKTTKEQQKSQLEEEITQLQKQITELQAEIKKELSEEDISIHIKLKQDKIIMLEKAVQDLSGETASLNMQKKQADDLKQEIANIDNCPTCKQEVGKEHKQMIAITENERIEAIDKKLNIIQQNLTEKQEQLDKHKHELEQLREKQNKIEVNKIKQQNFEENNKRYEERKTRQQILTKELETLEKTVANIQEQIQKYKDIDEIYTGKRQELEKIQESKNKVDREVLILQTEIKKIKETVKDLKEDIDRKEKLKKDLLHFTQLQEWLEKHFLTLMDIIEKNIMLKVHKDFDSLFQRWFNMIIDSDVLNSKLDPTFTPSIDQNGHDIDYGYLSGGEKTAIALSYRLALNQVINKLMRNIKTNDLLILDEPTDGFSNEQLDKVKDVIEDLDLKQIIIVSHEPKVESFVNHTIKFQKDNHISQAISQ
ncbi:MAG: hypothetical protein L6408_01810, partial [Nanoarchaeota archaeon]|nr:hypothetical protein [Nanoarchaeota archaeon]